ncbi:Anaerobic sulfite reductase subunit A [subsurface metagenome]
MEKTLGKEYFHEFLEYLKQNYRIAGPTRKGGATAYTYLTFDYVEKTEDLELDYQTSMVPPKRLFAPDNEALFGFKKVGSDVILEDLGEKGEKKCILLGIHPCDIVAISRLDKVFAEVYRDPYYWNRRENTIIIGQTCDRAGDYCFCNITGSGPDIEGGYDLLMTDIGDSYFFRTGSQSGEKLIQRDYFKAPTPEDKRGREERLENIRQGLKDDFNIEGIVEVMKEKYNDKLWDEYGERCVTCGVCNMVCPTCHCFAILDRANVDQTEGKRIRVWDSCHFERFAKMASGLDLREEKGSRFKHRLYDKFYYPPVRYGDIFCVGCGRCIEFCQSRIDIRDALKKLQKGLK